MTTTIGKILNKHPVGVYFIEIIYFLLQLLNLNQGGLKKRTPERSKAEYEVTEDDFIEELQNFPFMTPKGFTYDKLKLLGNYYKETLASEIKSFGKIHSVLEVGCGVGRNLIYLKKEFPNISFYGIDIAENRIKKAREHSEGMNIKYSVCSAEKLDFKDNEFDLIYTVHALEQMPTIIKKVIPELQRVNKEGIILIEPFYSVQNCFGRLHNFRGNFVKNITEQANLLFKTKKFEKLPYGMLTNRPALFVGVKK